MDGTFCWLFCMPVAGEAVLVGPTAVGSWPAMGSGSLLKALFLLSTRSMGEVSPPSPPALSKPGALTGLLGAKSELDPWESLVRFFLRKPRDGIGPEDELERFSDTGGYQGQADLRRKARGSCRSGRAFCASLSFPGEWRRGNLC